MSENSKKGRGRRVNLASAGGGKSPVQYPAESLDLDAAITSFIRYCRIRNLTQDTLNFYRDTLLELTRQLQKQNVERPIDIVKDTIMVALETKRSTPIKRGKAETPADATMDKLTRSWRAFFNWMHSESFVEINPFVGLGKAKSERSIIETFSNAQMKSLLNAPNRSTFTGLRDYTIMLTLLDTGIRISELEGISLHHVNWSDRTVKVYGKGRKERLVPISRALEKALRNYTEVRGVLDCDSLFVNIDNNTFKVRGIQQAIKLYGQDARIKGVRVSPHTFRHTFAKMYIMNGGDAFSLQKILGHTSLDIVRMYVNLFGTDISEKHDRHSPLENL
ncbi:tyrosine-type recombinase/integrase [Paenibacillus sp. Leaf72]|uniref:tyrosine-type recombinase/integrase n=1 Tax=Paenibacillus sp. Leaf72 TaxID=1736234 RepID=UPI0007C7FBF9|nr:tyrosine-type recombinase/integrase [Paenibacillus sp. Leaf72]